MAYGKTRCDCGRRKDAGGRTCTFCEADMFWGLTPVDTYIEQKQGLAEVGRRTDTDDDA